MTPTPLPLPILIILSGALLTALFGQLALSRRFTVPQVCWVLALFPLTALSLLAADLPDLKAGATAAWQMAWLPALGLKFSLYYDSLSALFAILVTFIGTLVVVYTGYYFKGKPDAWRFLTYLLLFMASMLGVVMAGDVITLFIFWEGTSIVSFLLAAYNSNDESARQGGFKALLITGAGGIALLLGLLAVSAICGDTAFTVILKNGDLLRNSPHYSIILFLVALGAFTKSAQFPFHIWLPGAMSAPTPASAYLHSATMVKAGIYLMARLNPALGQTETWFWLLTLAGMITMLTGAWQGIRQTDLKALLANSTICQLGILMMMIGQDIAIAFKALVIGTLAHALYKSALFLVAGIIDHETGTRDLRRLGGLRRAMPITFAITLLAALSMGGLPPLFGFLAKETLLATTVHASLPRFLAWFLPASTVVAGALLLVQSGILICEVFLGRPRDPSIHAHEAPFFMLAAPAIPAILSIIDALLPDPQTEAYLLANAASAAHGFKVKVSLAMWAGLNVPLMLSGVAVTLGTILFFQRNRIRAFQEKYTFGAGLNGLYAALLSLLDKAAALATRLQTGSLRTYLSVIVVGAMFLVVGFGGIHLPPLLPLLTWPTADLRGEILALKVFALLITVGTALASILLKRDFNAIVAMGASGLGIAVLMALEPAPDVALVQIVVDMLTLVILVLALIRLPEAQRLKAQTVTYAQSHGSLIRDTLIAGTAGLVVMGMTLKVLLSRPHPTAVTPFYEVNAKLALASKSIVGAIIVDFRALDTLLEITVFGMAGLGIFMLLRFAAIKHGDECAASQDTVQPICIRPHTRGIGGFPPSPLIGLLAHFSLPAAMVVAVTHMLYGHDQPGDGFTAGVIVSLAIGFWYLVFGYHETRQRLGWIKPSNFIACGILLVVAFALLGIGVNGQFFSNVDIGHMLGWHLPDRIHLSTSFLFEAAICLSVIGSVTHMLNTLGRPVDEDPECRLSDEEMESLLNPKKDRDTD